MSCGVEHSDSERKELSAGARVVCAMSGGVDSSVAAALLKDQGYEVIGVSMQVWDYRQNGGCSSRATCCSPDDFTDARRVAARIGIPYYVFDFERTFRREVIDRFVDTYALGKTPNPCVDCNSKVKFRELRDRAETFEARAVATGHYARVRRSARGSHLLRGAHRDKDQSYFLYGLKQSELAQTLFPVGDMTKQEVRERAAEAGLVTAEKPESQDICFVSGSVPEFLVSVGAKRRSGKIVTTRGEVVGTHNGVQSFTIGQRRGLGIGGTEHPMYVVAINNADNSVIVGERADLRREGFVVDELNLLSPDLIADFEARGTVDQEVMIQVRSRHEGARARFTYKDGTAQITFSDDWAPVAPGQAAVLYDLANEEVLGGGRIGQTF